MLVGKTYIDTVKYVIKAHLNANGLVEKPDVIGAIFGQTEGLLGDELDLRELQKSGRIGRIEVNLETRSGKTFGTIIIPSSLDRVETAIIAAAVETVDRIGPCEARITVETIEDTRMMKRQYVIERAKEILQRLIHEVLPESKTLTERVREEVKSAELIEYGPEKLPAGPSVDESDHIIVVEGRADVLNLLKANIENVISLKGKDIPKTVIDLSKEKIITVFVDGDRGGDLIVKSLAEVADVDYVARAPDGKEVEELTRKEILACLRRKIPLSEYLSKISNGNRKEPKDKYMNILKTMRGSLKAKLFDKEGSEIKEIDVKDLVDELGNIDGVNTVVMDGIVTQRVIDKASEKGVKKIYAVRKARIENERGIEVITFS